MEEKRIFPRFSLNVPVILDDKVMVEMKNISIGGLCLVTKKQICRGSNVVLTFTLPSNDEIRSQGQITWSQLKSKHNCECGIEFENLTVNDFEIIRGYITKKSH